ncbi:MAG: nucleoside hydrolase [Chloroflexota bacterium]
MNKLIIDTDPGLDDAQAIFMAAHHPNWQIEALTAVAGNVGLEHTLRNTCVLVDQLGQDIPVYAGCDKGLVFTGEDASYFHGKDGFGDCNLPDPQTAPHPKHAALALIDHIRAAPGEITLAAIGPLTNVAIALHLEPNLPRLLKRFLIMGGAVTSKGNAPNLASEFNFYADPEAAQFVMEQWGKSGQVAEIVDWESTVRHLMEIDWVNQVLAKENKSARFIGKITQTVREKLHRGVYYAADPLALAVTLEPEIVTQAETHHMRIETSGPRGQSTVDWGDRSGKPLNAKIVLKVDQKRFEKLFETGITGNDRITE